LFLNFLFTHPLKGWKSREGSKERKVRSEERTRNTLFIFPKNVQNRSILLLILSMVQRGFRGGSEGLQRALGGGQPIEPPINPQETPIHPPL